MSRYICIAGLLTIIAIDAQAQMDLPGICYTLPLAGGKAAMEDRRNRRLKRLDMRLEEMRNQADSRVAQDEVQSRYNLCVGAISRLTQACMMLYLSAEKINELPPNHRDRRVLLSQYPELDQFIRDDAEIYDNVAQCDGMLDGKPLEEPSWWERLVR